MLQFLADNWLPFVLGVAVASAVWAVFYIKMYRMFYILWENERAGNQSVRRKLGEMDKIMKDVIG